MSSNQKTSKTFFLRISSLIPGFKDYNSKENLRINDYEIRKFCAKTVNEKKDGYNDLKKKAIEEKQHDLVLKLDKSQTILRNFSDKLRLSKHGYSAVFDKEDVVDQEKLKQVLENDEKLIDLAGKLSDDTQSLEINRIIESTDSMINEMKAILKTREELLR